MGKKRHTQDKLFLSAKEMLSDWGGKREEHEQKHLEKDLKVQKLPFYCCNMSLVEAQEPYCAAERVKDKD